MLEKIVIELLDGTDKTFTPRVLDPNQQYVFFLHDFKIGTYWGDKKDGYSRGYPDKKGRPETVVTFEKENRVSLSSKWQQFHEDIFSLAAFGKVDRSMFNLLQSAFIGTMASNRVITNRRGYPTGYMPLAMGGNLGHVIGENQPNAKFGPAWQIETLNGSEVPPDVEEVFFTKPWLWSRATVIRYARPEDEIQGLANPWQHVIPFPQLDFWNAHTPLLLISNTGMVHVQKSRCSFTAIIRNPYFPHLDKVYF